MSFGVTSTGFVPKRFDDIKAELEAAVRTAYPNADLSPESNFGQLIAISALAHAEEWEVLGQIYAMQSIYSAEGIALDDNVLNSGFYRLPSTSATVELMLIRSGGSAVTVPIGTIFADAQNQFYLESAVTIDYAATVGIIAALTLTTEEVGTTFGITINSIDYAITTDAGSHNTTDIIEDLAGQLSAFETDSLNNALRVASPDEFSFGLWTRDVGENVIKNDFPDCWAWGGRGLASNLQTGVIATPVNAITTIVTPVANLATVSNPFQSQGGRDAETDYELRVRIEESRQSAGAGTLPAIVARVLAEVPEVSSVRGYENRTDITDGNDLPPHSFMVTVEGGTDEAIANKIWDLKPAGIETYGDTSVYILDLNGETQLVRFARPDSLLIWVKAELTLSGEETFPSNGATLVRNAIFDYGSSIPAGIDVYATHFIPAILTVPGIGTIAVSISLNGTDWITNKITVTGSDTATLINDGSHIIVTVS